MSDANLMLDAILFLVAAMFANWQVCVSLLFALLALGLAFNWWDAHVSKMRWDQVEREQAARIRDMAAQAAALWVAKHSRRRPLPVRRSHS